MTLRDLLTGEVHSVSERNASQSLDRHDVIYAQLVILQGLTLLEATSPVALAPDDKVEIISLRQRMRHSSNASAETTFTNADLRAYAIELRDLYLALSEARLHPSMPAMQTSDGEAIEFHKLVFDIDSAQTAFEALRHLDPYADDPLERKDDAHDDAGNLHMARIHWMATDGDLEAGSTLLGRIEIKGQRMTAHVHSRERAERLQAIVRDHLAGQARFRADQVQTIEQALTENREAPPPQTAGDPETQELLADMLSAHYDAWIDTALPALNDRTPRDALREPGGAEQVEALLQQAERFDPGLSRRRQDAIFRDVRKQLGLPSTGSASS